MSENNSDDISPENFSTPYQALVDHCENNGLNFSADPDQKSIRMQLCRTGALYNCILRITNDDSIFQIHLHYPVLAKDEKIRPSALEFIARANYGLVLGSFELDMRDGEVRFHISHLLDDRTLLDSTIYRMVSTALSTADRYFPSFMRLLYGGETAEDAVFLAELEMHADAAGYESAEPRHEATPSSELPAPTKRKNKARRTKAPKPRTPTKKPAVRKEPPELPSDQKAPAKPENRTPKDPDAPAS